MEKIKEIKAFKVGLKVFESLPNARKYKFEELDEIVLGDYVIVKYPGGGSSNIRGTVFFIDKDKSLYYFAIGDSNIPKEFFGIPLEGKIENLKFKQRIYSFDVGIKSRRELLRTGNNYDKVIGEEAHSIFMDNL